MSQLLIVQGANAEQVKSLFQSATAIFGSLTHLRPCDQLITRLLAVATFPWLKASTPRIVRNRVSDTWICGPGTWFYQGTGGQSGLLNLAQHTGHFENAEGWLNEIDGQFAIALKTVSDDLLIITD